MTQIDFITVTLTHTSNCGQKLKILPLLLSLFYLHEKTNIVCQMYQVIEYVGVLKFFVHLTYDESFM